jgi:hypothetical protein
MVPPESTVPFDLCSSLTTCREDNEYTKSVSTGFFGTLKNIANASVSKKKRG